VGRAFGGDVLEKHRIALAKSVEAIQKYELALAAFEKYNEGLKGLLREARRYVPADADGLGQRIDGVLK
jgi:hypothetical protein